MTTVYFCPDCPTQAVVQINILDNDLSEREENFSLQMKNFDASIILNNNKAEIVVTDDDSM